MYIYIYIHIHTYIHTYIYIYVHIYSIFDKKRVTQTSVDIKIHNYFAAFL